MLDVASRLSQNLAGGETRLLGVGKLKTTWMCVLGRALGGKGVAARKEERRYYTLVRFYYTPKKSEIPNLCVLSLKYTPKL